MYSRRASDASMLTTASDSRYSAKYSIGLSGPDKGLPNARVNHHIRRIVCRTPVDRQDDSAQAGPAPRRTGASNPTRWGRAQRAATFGRIAAFPFQNDSLAANWICRDDPASPVGRRVLVILPKVGLPTTLPGGPRLGWLNRSKTSARSCRPTPLPACTFLISDSRCCGRPAR